MSSEITADIFNVTGALRFQREGATALVDIPANGVLQLHVASGAAITLGDGGATQLLGIEYVDDNGNPVELSDDQTDVKFLLAAPGVTITALHARATDLLAAPIPETQRIITSSGKDFVLEQINAQIFFAYVPLPVDGFRWYLVDRPNFNADPGHWATPNPNTVFVALAQLAERAPLVVEGSVAFTNGNPVNLWNYTLDEGEAIGIRFQLTGATLTGGTLVGRCLGRITAVASRDVGDVAAVTTGIDTGSIVGGTLLSGVMSVAAVGNDVIVRVTFLTDGTLHYKLRIEVDPVIPA